MIMSVLYSAEEDKAYYKAYQRGNVFLKNKMYEKALHEYKLSIEKNPLFLQSYLNIGVIYDQYLHDYRNALVYYIKYLETGDGKAEKLEQVKKWIYNIVHLKYATSDEEFKELQNGLYFHNQGVKLAKKKNYEEAIKKFEKAFSSIPYYVRTHYAAGIAYFQIKEYGKSYKHFMQVLKYDPDNKDFLETYYYLGLLHDDILIKDYDHAYSFYSYYKNNGGMKDVKKWIEPIIKINSLIERSMNKFQDGDVSASINILKEALKIKSSDVRIYNNLGALYITQKEYEKAENHLKRSLSIRIDVSDTYYNFACLYSRKKEVGMALKYYKKGLPYFTEGKIKESLNDPDLENLRKEKDFKKLMKEYND